MTRSHLLDNNTTLLIFYFYSNDEPRDPENRRQNWLSERRFSETFTSWIEKRWLSANISRLVSVDLIEKKESSQVRIKIYITWGIDVKIIINANTMLIAPMSAP